MSRANNIAMLDAGFLNLLYRLYDVDTPEAVLKKPEHKLETVVYELFQSPTESYPEIVKVIGMVIPKLTTRRYFQFIVDSFLMYKDVVPGETPDVESYREEIPLDTFVDSMKRYGDVEILKAFRYYGPFFGRMNLLYLLHENLYNNTFQLYNSLDSQVTKRVLDTETPSGIPLNDLPLPILTFGSYFNLSLLSIPDLNSAFYVDNVNRFSFQVPGSELLFAVYKIWQLLALLPYMKQDSALRTFQSKVKAMLIGENNSDTYELSRTHLNPQFPPSYPEEKRELFKQDLELYKRVFNYIFEAGQYMIGWEGPGSSYIESRPNVNIRPQATSILLLTRAWELLPKWFDLPALQFDELSGHLRQSDPLVTLLQQLLEQNFCHQYNALTLLDTAWFYKLVIESPIEQYDPLPLWPIT